MPESFDDICWLASADGTTWLRRVIDELPATASLVQRLRKELSVERTHVLLEQADLRVRAREKFPLAENMLFTRRGLEQSTDAYVAHYKAQRFPEGREIYDLCCGIGGDALALAARGPCVAMDLDPIMTALVSLNAVACGLGDMRADCGDVTQVELDADFWHIDPDRRVDGQRHTRVEGYQPGVDFLEKLTAAGRGGAMKLAPAADLPPELMDECQLEWISRGGECKQLVGWYGELAADFETRRASVLSRTGELVDQVVGQEDDPFDGSAAESLGKYVFDPDAAVLAAHLVGQLAADRHLQVIDPLSKYLTGDQLPEVGALAAFEVIEVLPLDIRKLKHVLQSLEIGRLELKKRGAPVELPQLEKQLRTKGNEAGTVIVTPWREQTMAIVCRRVPGEA